MTLDLLGSWIFFRSSVISLRLIDKDEFDEKLKFMNEGCL